MVVANLTFVLPLAIGICVDRDWQNWDVGVFARVGQIVGGDWLKIWVIVASMFTNAGLFNAAMTTSSRALASLAEKKYFPWFIGVEVPKLVCQVPLVLIIIRVHHGLPFLLIAL